MDSHRLYAAIQNNKHFILLFILLFFIAIVMMGDLIEPVVTSTGMRLIIFLAITSVLVLSIYAENKNPGMFKVNLAFIVPALIFQLLFSVTQSDFIHVLSLFFSLVFMISIVCCMLYNILFTRCVSREIILSSICIYLLLGILWSNIYIMIVLVDPGSFTYSAASSDYTRIMLHSMYFSFVTITTLGYGDIQPLSSPAQFFSVLEALMGQIYLTVLIARLVGLHIASAAHDKTE